MNGNYIKCSDPGTIKKLRDLGFIILNESKGVVTFLNNIKDTKTFADMPVAFSNKLDT